MKYDVDLLNIIDVTMTSQSAGWLQGQWWEAGAQQAVPMASLRQAVPGLPDSALADGDGAGGEGGLAALAAGQRFSSPAARAAFCIIMGASDYLDAAERLQRAGLKVRRQWQTTNMKQEPISGHYLSINGHPFPPSLFPPRAVLYRTGQMKV